MTFGTTILGIQGLKNEMLTMVKKIEVLKVHNQLVSQCHICFLASYIVNDRIDFQVGVKGSVLIVKIWLS